MKIRNKQNKKSIVISIILLCLSAGGIAYFFISQNADKSPPSIVTQGGQKATSDPDVPKSDDHNDNTLPIDRSSSSSPAPNIPIGVKPAAPIGTFVSNHYPNLSGEPTPNRETSTCSTTPGAVCKIIFSTNNNQRELSARTADSNGNVQWDWTLQEIGLTEGVWTITAIASNGDLTSRSNDSTKLTVRP